VSRFRGNDRKGTGRKMDSRLRRNDMGKSAWAKSTTIPAYISFFVSLSR
jgi:hypothetical protein